MSNAPCHSHDDAASDSTRNHHLAKLSSGIVKTIIISIVAHFVDFYHIINSEYASRIICRSSLNGLKRIQKKILNTAEATAIRLSLPSLCVQTELDQSLLYHDHHHKTRVVMVRPRDRTWIRQSYITALYECPSKTVRKTSLLIQCIPHAKS